MDNWTKEDVVLNPINPNSFNPELVVRDLWVAGSKVWDVSMVSNIMSAADAELVFKTPLLEAIRVDGRLWWPGSKGSYTIRSAYWLCINRLLKVDHLKMESEWKQL